VVAVLATAQIAACPANYLCRMNATAKTKSSEQPRDFTLAVQVSADTYEWSKVLLARAHSNGKLELLTAAWEMVLGYGRRELVGKTLSQLMGSTNTESADVVLAILDERNTDPVELTLRSRSGEAKRLRLHRRLDAYANKVFIVAEETAHVL
jgi:PAS domain S-box-containing protein